MTPDLLRAATGCTAARAALASLYSIHLLVGWWLDRLGIKWERSRRPRGRRTWRNWRGAVKSERQGPAHEGDD